MIDFVNKRYWFYGITAILIAITIVALVSPKRLPWGLEFSSGSSLTIDFLDKEQTIEAEDVRTQLIAIGLEESKVQETGTNSFFIRTTRVEDDLVTLLTERFGLVQTTSLEGANNLADLISFLEPVAVEELRELFVEEPGDLIITQTGEGGYFLSASGVSMEGLDASLAGYEQRFGPVERLSYSDPESMALTLDFGPAVPVAEFEGILGDLTGEFENLSTGSNAFLVVGLGLDAETRDGFVPMLGERFGRAEVTTYRGDGDMAILLTFADGAAISDIRNELFTQSFFTTIVLPAGEDTFAFLAKDVDADRQTELLGALQDMFGTIDRRDFDFDTGIAVLVDFGQTVALETLRDRVGEIEPGSVAIGLGGSGFFIGGANIAAERQDEIVSELEEGFGLADRQSFDFADSFALRIAFADPIQLEDLVSNLVIIPVTDVVGDRVSVQRLETDSFFLVGTGIAAEAQSRLLDSLEAEVGTLERVSFDAGSDLAVVLDFGPAVTVGQLRDVVDGLAPDSFSVESIQTGGFLIAGQDVDQERIDGLIDGVEVQFGPAEFVTFDGEGDIALQLEFQDDTTVAEVRSSIAGTLAGRAIQAVFTVSESLTGDSFFLVATGATQEEQDAVFTAMTDALGIFDRIPLDFTLDAALSLDFGPVVSQQALATAVSDLGFDSVMVEALSDGFFLGATGLSAERREALLDGLKGRLGGARQTPFDSSHGMAVVVNVMDPERIAEAVSKTVIVQKVAPNSFFLGETTVSSQVEGAIFSALQAGLGPLQQNSFDFSDNVAMILSFQQSVTETAIRSTLEPFNYTNLVIEERGDNTYFIRGDRPGSDQKNKIIGALESAFGAVDRGSLEFSFVDAEIARRSVLNTFYAVLGAAAGILLYVWWAFRRAPKPFRYGVSAVVGLLHDVAIVLGAFGIMAKFRGVEIDSLMIIGILAVIGYSVNNTIVVLDRLRENLARQPGRALEPAVNVSLNETLSRNLNTSATTCLAILAVLLFGGETIFNFMLVLLVGVAAGTYSSLFLAANILVSWEKGELRLRLPFSSSRAAARQSR